MGRGGSQTSCDMVEISGYRRSAFSSRKSIHFFRNSLPLFLLAKGESVSPRPKREKKQEGRELSSLRSQGLRRATLHGRGARGQGRAGDGEDQGSFVARENQRQGGPRGALR